MKRVLVSAVLLLSACATVEAPQGGTTAAAGGGLKSTDVTTGFLASVMDGCAAAAEAGKTLEQLNSALFVRDDGRSAMAKPRAGVTPWAPTRGQGIVMIDESKEDCVVSAYGAPVGLTFEAIAKVLGERGYVAKDVPPQGALFYGNELSKSVNGRTIVVSLQGNEPGAAGTRSRFSTLIGMVRVTTP